MKDMIAVAAKVIRGAMSSVSEHRNEPPVTGTRWAGDADEEGRRVVSADEWLCRRYADARVLCNHG